MLQRSLEGFRSSLLRLPDSIDIAWRGLGALIRVLIIVLSFAAAMYGFREMTHHTLIIESVSVPKQYADAGITSDVIANRIKDAVDAIEVNTKTSMHKDRVGMRSDELSAPDVEVPGTKLGLRSVIEMIRAIFPSVAQSTNVGGEITLSLPRMTSTSANDQGTASLTIRFKRGSDTGEPIVMSASGNDVQALAQNAAEAILREINPYVLAVYRYHHGDAESALKLAEGTAGDLTLNTRHRAAAFNLCGLILDDYGKRNEAIAAYRKSVELDPKFAGYYSNWGRALAEQGQFDEAISKYKKSIELDRKFAVGYYNWGSALDEQQKYEAAATKYQKAVELDSNYAQAYNNLGRVLAELQRYSAAIAEYQKAVKADPKLAISYSNWGNALDDLQKYPDAIVEYQRAIETDPRLAVAYSEWGKALDDQGMFADAIPKYQRALELDPKLSEAYNNWGSALHNLGRQDEAISKYRKAIEIDPKFAMPYNNWGMILEKRQKYDEAINMYQKAFELDPKFTQAARNRDRVIGEKKLRFEKSVMVANTRSHNTER
jgi:tetratricopeptide (TPR) repeat protein